MSTLGSGADLNNCVDAGTIYTCNSGSIAQTLVNRPNDNFAFGLYVRHAPLSPNTIYQILFSNSGKVWQRKRDNNNWASWQQFSFDIPSFYKDYANLASLANGLANTGMFKYMSITEGIDFNDTDAWCWCYLGGQVTGDSTNKPSEVIGSIESSLVTFGVGNYKMQLFFVRDTIYYRHRVTAGWNTWKKITLTSI